MAGTQESLQGPALSLLLIDDDAELCSMMKELFLELNCKLECAYNGRDGLARALQNQYDLVILDIMLPVVNGFTVLQQLRRRSPVPVIMLTARGNPQDRITGLDSGADDYLAKPFDPDELFARVRAVLRRAGKLQVREPIKTFGKIESNPANREIRSAGQILDLTSLEFDILDLLIRAGGRIVSRDEIMGALFERQATPYDRSLDVHISHLRSKLEQGHGLIRTIRGVGYVFTAEPGPGS